MLDSLRRGSQTLVAKLLLGVLVLSFAIWGVSGAFTGGNNRAVATVGDTEIDVDTFARIYNTQVQNLSRQLGQPLPPEQAVAFGMPQYVLSQLQAEAALTNAARQMGLGLSDEELATIIASDPSLQVGGRFNRDALVQYLRQQGVSEARFVELRREAEIGSQITAGLLSGLTPPEALVELAYRHSREQRTVDAVILEPIPMDAVEDPTPEVLDTYFADQMTRYRAPEYRAIRLLTLSPETLARPADVTEDEARAEYERTIDSFGTPERRRVEQILFPSAEAAEAAREAILAGTLTFEEAGAENSLIQLDLLARDEFVDPAIGEAAFALPENELSDVIAGRFGSLLIRVNGVEPAVVQPFEEVAEQIRLQIAEASVQSEIPNLHDEIENDRIGGDDLAAIAERYGLEVRDIPPVDATGADIDGTPIAGLPADVDLLGAAFDATPGVDADPLTLGRSGYVWFEVTEIVEARDRTLDEVRDTVVADWKEEEAANRLEARAQAMAETVRSGTPLADVAAAEGLTVETSARFTREEDNALLGPDGVAAAFDGPVGHVAEAQRPQGGRVVLVVRDRATPAFFAEEAGAQEAAQTYSQAMLNGMTDQLVAELVAEAGVTVNQQLLQAAIGLNRQ